MGEKVKDIVRRQLNPHDQAIFNCVAEKTKLQALHHVQPLLPMALGSIEGDTDHDIRYGTNTRFAALDVVTRSVMGKWNPNHSSH